MKLSLVWAENFALTAFLCSLAWRETCHRGYKAKEKHLSEERLLYRKFVLGPMALFLPFLPEANAYDFCSRLVCLPVINASVVHSLSTNHWSVHLWPLESMTAQIKGVHSHHCMLGHWNTLTYFLWIIFLFFPWK